jgi:hypothetical protein
VADLLEPLEGLAAHALGGGVGGDELGVLGLEALELVVEGVVLGVGDLRRVLHVVAPVVVADLLAQLLDPAPHVHALGHAGIIRAVPRHPKRVRSAGRRRILDRLWRGVAVQRSPCL